MNIGSIIFGSLKRIGGYQVFTYNLLKRLAHAGHSVHLYVTQEEYARSKPFYNRMPFEVRPLFFSTQALAKHLPWVLMQYLRRQQNLYKYDVWQIVGSYPAAYLASSLAGKVPLVLRTHGIDIQKDADLNYGLRLDPRLEKLIAKTVRRMDRVVAMTQTIADCYRELEVPESRIVEIPNGVDVGRFATPSDKSQTRSMWGLPLETPLLLTVGRYHPKKGYAVIPEIARALKDKGIQFFWQVVGGGTEALDPLIEQAGVSDVVGTEREIGVSDSFEDGHGPIIPDDKLVRLYQCADIFVFPSRLEGFPRVLIEAMATGLPVVSTDAPGCREVVRHGDTGLVASPDDIEGLAAHIINLIENEDLRHRLTGNGSAQARRYDWDNVVASYELLYQSLLC